MDHRLPSGAARHIYTEASKDLDKRSKVCATSKMFQYAYREGKLGSLQFCDQIMMSALMVFFRV